MIRNLKMLVKFMSLNGKIEIKKVRMRLYITDLVWSLSCEFINILKTWRFSILWFSKWWLIASVTKIKLLCHMQKYSVETLLLQHLLPSAFDSVCHTLINICYIYYFNKRWKSLLYVSLKNEWKCFLGEIKWFIHHNI